MRYHRPLLFTLILPMILAAITPAFAKERIQKTQPVTVSKYLHFIENKRHVVDQHYKSRTDIDFKLGSPGINVFAGDEPPKSNYILLRSTFILCSPSLRIKYL